VLQLLQGTILGAPGRLSSQKREDLSGREILILTVFAGAVLLVGLHPAPLLELIELPLDMLSAQWSR
jgi:NADH:ubiquinone oxidoreductase subunit 4 (subunit M)